MGGGGKGRYRGQISPPPAAAAYDVLLSGGENGAKKGEKRKEKRKRSHSFPLPFGFFVQSGVFSPSLSRRHILVIRSRRRKPLHEFLSPSPVSQKIALNMIHFHFPYSSLLLEKRYGNITNPPFSRVLIFGQRLPTRPPPPPPPPPFPPDP